MIFKKEETEVASSGKVACVTEEFAKARVSLSSDIFEKKPVPKLEPKSASFRDLYIKWPNPDPTQIGVSIGLNHPRIKSDFTKLQEFYASLVLLTIFIRRQHTPKKLGPSHYKCSPLFKVSKEFLQLCWARMGRIWVDDGDEEKLMMQKGDDHDLDLDDDGYDHDDDDGWQWIVNIDDG